ncbi:alpha/beta-hydrolase [Cryphonectria parasitica EP155]|uniref:Alpha/beta-hydrolase n=1 Tax=Cryphonectria parasitica (strain ATCC 38755 / EP155) TaxID=660469 RepID=A0A9P5CLJ2_CRYP1|nr:alpha/beta-hydrolase [Cryphonectria parasitica EP155]KAF3763399.1 alpha/beta-hydrolase [Cryphonectria parasitica EP155]
MASFPTLPLPEDIRQRHIDLTTEPTCGLNIFVLEAGDASHPLILLFHGYPELAYTWRKVLLPLASKGFHVVAPDSRGYGRTTGWDTSSYAHVDLSKFTQMQLILDNIALMRALGHEEAALVVGHDFGATAASACSLTRPDLFKAAVFVSHVPTGSAERGREDIHTALARRERPLMHYQWYNSTARAAEDWKNPSQGLKAFLRGYVHLKSHVWKGNEVDIGPLRAWIADQLARMPGYYIMPLGATMPEVVEADMKDEDTTLTESFLSDAELDVYVQEFTRTGFQGMLNWYRSATSPQNVNSQMAVFAGLNFQVPVTYIGGVADWGNYQRPGALEALQSGKTASDYRGTRILPGAGHWPQVELPNALCDEIVKFLAGQ